MKLTVPPIHIDNQEGFSPEKDIFRRKGFGEKLLNLVENTDEQLVIALDAPWGEGKSTFVKMWRGMLRENEIHSIYFDSFENDYQDSPFLAIAGEIYELIDDSNKTEKSEFKDKTVSALKTMGRVGLRIGVKTATAGILDETIFDDLGTSKDASKEASDMVDKYVSSKLESVSQNKKNIQEFRTYLQNLPKQLNSNGKPLVFIIDELDRCKPPFALAILEIIKHLFSVPNITFVLVMNRDQLEESVRCEYGRGVESEKYLQKFINLWASLPKSKEEHNCDTKVYLSNCFKQMGLEANSRNSHEAVEAFEELAAFYDMSLREIERSLTNFSIIHNITDANLVSEYQWMAVYVSIIKVLYPSAYRRLLSDDITYDELVSETALSKLRASWWEDDKPEGHPLRWYLRYYLSTDEEVKLLLEKGNVLGNRRGGRKGVQNVCKWLESFQRS